MKIDDSFSPSIATLAMPKGSNFLTDIGDGINGYYKQKDEDRKNAMLMKKADDEMLDRQTQADYLNSGKSYTDWIASGGTAFKTSEAIENTTKFTQANSLWDLQHTNAKNEMDDGTLIGKYYTPPEMAKDGTYLKTTGSIDKIKDWNVDDEKINIGKQKIIEDATHNRKTEEIATVNSGIAATNAQTNIENAKTNKTNAAIKAAEVADKIENKEKTGGLTAYQKLQLEKDNAANKIAVSKAAIEDNDNTHFKELNPKYQQMYIADTIKYGVPPKVIKKDDGTYTYKTSAPSNKTVQAQKPIFTADEQKELQSMTPEQRARAIQLRTKGAI